MFTIANKIVSSLPLELAVISFFLALVAYVLWLILRNKSVGKIASLFIFAAVAMLTWYLASRWLNAGRPPLASQFESLIAFAWCIGISWLIIEQITGLKHGGAGASLMALLFLASTWLLDDAIVPLLPALQDNFWLTTHVALCFVGYSGLALALIFAIMHLLSAEERIHRAGILALLLFFLCLGAAAAWHKIPISQLAAWQTARILIPLVLLATGIMLTIVRADVPVIPLPKRWQRSFVLLAIIGALLGGAHFLFMQTGPVPYRLDSGGKSSPALDLVKCLHLYLLPTLLIILAFIIVFKFSDPLRLAAKATLQFSKSAYLAVLFGFPFLGIGIITGSVWANQAWGRYWGWDPKETSSLVAWIIFAIYLHFRLVAGTKKTAVSWIVVAGFLAVIFTYFGVNYLHLLGVDSLHQYVNG